MKLKRNGLRLDGGGTQEEELRKAVWDGEVVSALRAFCEQLFPVSEVDLA